MPQFRRKPYLVKAVQWTGRNVDEVKGLVGDRGWTGQIWADNSTEIQNLDGKVSCYVNDWIVEELAGEFTVYGPEWFTCTFEPV